MVPFLSMSCLLWRNSGNIENSEICAIIEVTNKIWEPRKERSWSDCKNTEDFTSESNISWLCRVSSYSIDRECTERHFRQEEFNKHGCKNGHMPGKKPVI